MNFLRASCFLAALPIMGGCTNFFGSHSCSAVYIPSETVLTVQSPNNAWIPGAYALAVGFDGMTVQCSMDATDAALASPNVVQGTCDTSNVAFMLQPVCPERPAVCDAGVCVVTSSSADCLPGQFQMNVVILPEFGADAASSNPTQVSFNLSVNGASWVNETVAPTQTTSEPNGEGCGTVTKGAATVALGIAPDAGDTAADAHAADADAVD
jgi:hypothetical protein